MNGKNLFSIWKFTQHQAVYTDPRRIPFTVSYYNWAYCELSLLSGYKLNRLNWLPERVSRVNGFLPWAEDLRGTTGHLQWKRM